MEKTIFAIPNVSTPRFTKGKTYRFEHKINALYATKDDCGNEKFTCYPFPEKDPHLWDGKDWAAAGKFVEVEE